MDLRGNVDGGVDLGADAEALEETLVRAPEDAPNRPRVRLFHGVLHHGFVVLAAHVRPLQKQKPNFNVKRYTKKVCHLIVR
jgi:hypothetical protein